jgi:hypothetical protein
MTHPFLVLLNHTFAWRIFGLYLLAQGPSVGLEVSLLVQEGG